MAAMVMAGLPVMERATATVPTPPQVWAFGHNNAGQLGQGPTNPPRTSADPLLVAGLAGAPAVAAGGEHSVALKDGAVYSWGSNRLGQLGDGTLRDRSRPVATQGLSGITDIAAGGNHSLALKDDGTVWAWGNSIVGLATSTAPPVVLTPAPVAGLAGITAIADGGQHALAVGPGGVVWAWGGNKFGQLGQRPDVLLASPSPAPVPGLTEMWAVAAGDGHSLALRGDGTVWAFGRNNNGQLGDGTLTDRSSPAAVPGLADVVAIAAGGYGSLALKADGTVWEWGGWVEGGKSPVQVPGIATVVAIAGGASKLAVTAGNTLFSWGDNDYGQLGFHTQNPRVPSPVRVAQLPGTMAIAAGGGHSLATASAVSGDDSSLVAAPASVRANGVATSTITLTVRDFNGEPVAGKRATLVKSAGPGTPAISAPSGPSALDGTVSFRVSSTTPGTDTFSATVAGELVVQTAVVVFEPFAGGALPSATASSVVAEPSTVVADGDDAATLSVVVRDAANSPIAEVDVAFSASGPGTPSISPPYTTTGPDGRASVVASSITAGTVSFSVRANGVALAQVAQVNFTQAPGSIFTYAGGGLGNGPARQASQVPVAVAAADRPTGRFLYVADTAFDVVRVIDPTGTTTVVAGDGLVGDRGDGGPATAARLHDPHGVAVDASGNLYIADTANARLRRVVPGADGVVNGGADEVITTIAGAGVTDLVDEDGYPGATLFGPYGVVVDGATPPTIFVTDDNRVRKLVTGSPGRLTTYAGGGRGDLGSAPFIATNERFSNPTGLALDTAGNLFVADTGNRRVMRVSGLELADGTHMIHMVDGSLPLIGTLMKPQGLAVTPGGDTLYIADAGSNVVTKVTVLGIPQSETGTVEAGQRSPDGGYGGDGGDALLAHLDRPDGLALDSAGNLFIADAGNNRLRRLDPPATPGGTRQISTVAGPCCGGDGGPAASAQLFSPAGVALDQAGNLFIADPAGDRVLKVAARRSPDGTRQLSVYAGGRLADGVGDVGDSGPATEASLEAPNGVAADRFGNLYIADTGHHVVRKVSPSGMITTVAGRCCRYGDPGDGDGGDAAEAGLRHPMGVAVDQAGNLFIADTGNHTIRKVDVIRSSDGIRRISTVAGDGLFPACRCFERDHGNGGDALKAHLFAPRAVTVDAAGNLFIADTFNDRVKKVDAAPSADGTHHITTVAGLTTMNDARSTYPAHDALGDGGDATLALLRPTAVAVDAAGNLFIADNRSIIPSYSNEPLITPDAGRIRKVDAAASPDGTRRISTLAGGGEPPDGLGDGGPAAKAVVRNPFGVAVAPSGDVFVADTDNHRVRVVPGNLAPTTVDFPAQPVGTTSAARTVTVTNTATTPLSVSATTTGANGADFAPAGGTCADGPVAPKARCTLAVVFSPTATGPRQASLSVIDSPGGASHVVGLSGTGTAPLPGGGSGTGGGGPGTGGGGGSGTGSGGVAPGPLAAVAVPVPLARGYWLVASDGGVFAFGDARFFGSTGALRLNKPIVAIAASPSGKGYWLAGSDGGIFAFGDAAFSGSTGAIRLNKPIVAMASTPSGRGYWLVASDGGVFAFGNARFFGSTGALRLNSPIVAMAATPSGKGYWLAGSDGGIFAFGDAAFSGSTGAIRLNKPIAAMAATPTAKGYTLVASDGGVFAFGDARFFGSTGALRLNSPIVGARSTPSAKGYWLTAGDGGIFAFGDAAFSGSAGALKLNSPIVAMAVAAAAPSS